MRYSLSGFLFEDRYATQSLAFPEFCSLARELGYDGVELRGTQVRPDSPAEKRAAVRAQAALRSLAVTCLTARGMPGGGEERERFLDSYLDLCAELGCGLLKVGGEPEWMRRAADRAASRGVALAVNNHVGSSLQTVAGTKAYFAAVGHPAVGLLYDCYHLSAAGEDYVGSIPSLFPLVRNVLVHSIRRALPGEEGAVAIAGRQWMACMPDDPGAQDWRGVFTAFERLGYRGWVTVVEHGWPVDRRAEVARRNIAFLREVCG